VAERLKAAVLKFARRGYASPNLSKAVEGASL
jgi:hypothetical protein